MAFRLPVAQVMFGKLKVYPSVGVDDFVSAPPLTLNPTDAVFATTYTVFLVPAGYVQCPTMCMSGCVLPATRNE